MKNIKLHIFTNCTFNNANTTHIQKTYQSFCEVFGKIEPIVWYDPNPNITQSDLYYIELSKYFHNIVFTNSLSDGYIRAIESTKEDFLFMLEHDWEFIPERIQHNLEFLTQLMQEQQICHFRFNKHLNLPTNWETKVTESSYKNCSFCVTCSLGNSPHIIYKPLYIEQCLPYLNKDTGSKGIEHNLLNNFKGGIYGSRGFEPTISHLDGRNRFKGEQEVIHYI